ncbi:hypothetical protein B0H19DRAFT_234246 [Mycena capillaripes]|nr:hypothetical protein B0H19DRAFT_234246 [Mycena capillaripes]
MLGELAADRARIAEIEAQILDLDHERSALRIEKVLAQQRLDSYKYPVLALPNEMVSEIFIHFIPVYPLCPPLTGIHSPTLPTQICRSWREIALATPALWRAISLSHHDHQSKRQAHISDILSRSGCCPLSIQLDEYEAEDEDEDDDEDYHRMKITKVLSIVVPHLARWEYLKLGLFQPNLPAIVNGPMPLLRHLDLSLGSDDDDSTFQPFIVFSDVPLLRTVTLDDLATHVTILPWRQLTSLTLTRLTPNGCVPHLQQASNLVHCELRLCFSGPIDQLPDITLSSLESLTFADALSGPPIRYLETFILPALCRLEIPERFLGPNPITSLTSFVSKSGCKLKDLCIRGNRSVARESYRAAFSSILRFSFSKKLKPWITDAGNSSEDDSDSSSSDAKIDSALNSRSY